MLRFSLFCSVILILFQLPVSAQPTTGSNIDTQRSKMTGYHDPVYKKNPRAGINAIARCYAETHRARAADTLSMRYDSKDQAESLKKIFRPVEWGDACLLAKDLKFGFSTAPVVGGFAEFFLARKYGQQAVSKLSKLTEEDWAKAEMMPRNAYELFGQCVVMADAASVFGLVNTIPSTKAESKAIKKLVPLLSPCVPKDQEVSFDKTSLRAVLSFALYRAVDQQATMEDAE